MAARRALCSTCGENNEQVTCQGCSKRFCLTHFDDHRRELGTQFDEIEVARNVFRQTLTEKIAQPQNYTLIQQIDVWENESISRIRQVAQDAKQLLLNHIAELNSKLEDKLRQLTDQLQQSRKKNEFSERDLDEWREDLARMKNELTQPSDVKIQDDATPLIMKIIVAVSDVRNNRKFSGTRHATDVNKTKTAETSVFCSFCNEEWSSSAIGEHLMLCGNKTDQCPNCEKYIRRAVFAYHCENNCTDLDASEGDVRRDAKKRDTSLTFLSNNASNSSSNSAVRNYKKITAKEIHLAKFPNQQAATTSQYSHLGVLTYEVCPYCDWGCEVSDIERHQENCVKNPKNMTTRSQLQTNPTHSQNPVQFNHVNRTNDTAGIPCEYCHRTINWSDYQNHTQSCGMQHRPIVQERPQSYHNGAYVPGSDSCRYCHKQYMINHMTFHEKNCRQNPVNIALEEQHKNAHLPPAKFMPYQ